MNIRKNDNVIVISGEDRGKTGMVHTAFPDENRVLIKGVRITKRHIKPHGNIKQTGIVEREAPILVDKVMLICTKCQKPTRVGFRILEDKSRVRVCKKCHEVID